MAKARKVEMNIFFDTEFTGLHKGTTLISIGMVAEDGREFYAELTDFDKSQVNQWLIDNVINHLSLHPLGKPNTSAVLPSDRYCGNKSRIASDLRRWLEGFGEPLQLVADVNAYDWVLFCNLFGTAFDIPKCVSPAPVDINQMIAAYLKISPAEAFNVDREAMANLSYEGEKHNALWDAKVCRAIWGKVAPVVWRN